MVPMSSRSAIQVSVIVVSFLKREAIRSFSGSPFRYGSKSNSLQPKRASSSFTKRAAFSVDDSLISGPKCSGALSLVHLHQELLADFLAAQAPPAHQPLQLVQFFAADPWLAVTDESFRQILRTDPLAPPTRCFSADEGKRFPGGRPVAGSPCPAGEGCSHRADTASASRSK